MTIGLFCSTQRALCIRNRTPLRAGCGGMSPNSSHFQLSLLCQRRHIHLRTRPDFPTQLKRPALGRALDLLSMSFHFPSFLATLHCGRNSNIFRTTENGKTHPRYSSSSFNANRRLNKSMTESHALIPSSLHPPRHSPSEQLYQQNWFTHDSSSFQSISW